VTALLVLAVFAVFALMMYLRWMPALVAVPVMALLMALAAGVPFASLGSILTGGAVALAPVYVAVIFGGLLGRVTIDTGIARAIVNIAAEYGSEQPFALALVLCAIVAVLFTSLAGLGAIIVVGSIVLPIMMTTGVPRTIAATLFLMSFALGFIFNIPNWTFYTKTFGVVPQDVVKYAIVLAIVDAIALVVYAAISFYRSRSYATWAVRAPQSEAPTSPNVPAIALVTPVLPLILYYALHVEAVPAFLIAAVFGALVTRPRDAVQTLVAAAIRGVEDVAPAVLLFMGIGMLLVATREPQFKVALDPLTSGGWIANPVAYVVLFGLGSPLALYRGPLNPFGVGIAIFTALLASNAVPPVVLVAAVMAVVQVQNVCDPTNTQNVWVANFTGVSIETITRKTLPYQVAVAVIATIAVVLASPALFGVRGFASFVSPARADSGMPVGLYAPSQARGIVALDDDGSPAARTAMQAIAQALAQPQPCSPACPMVVHADPNARDCSGKRYAAYVLVTSSQFRLIEGTDLDIGLRLEDCGGWIVQEWHDHHLVTGTPQPGDARTLALSGLERLRGWSAAEPVRSTRLFTQGVASAPSDPPTYFYAIFKTVDGNMRAYVRAGGPAYAAGLRSDDVINKIDGKFWWEYGTYQTQGKAYDGQPHSFEVQRSGKTFDVQLGSAFSEEGQEASS
jgi:hypothetical protein